MTDRFKQVLFASHETRASADRNSATPAGRIDCAECVTVWRPITRMIPEKVTAAGQKGLIGHRRERGVVWRKSHMWRGLTHHGNMV